jgi:hypothetical protein
MIQRMIKFSCEINFINYIWISVPFLIPNHKLNNIIMVIILISIHLFFFQAFFFMDHLGQAKPY